VIEEWALRYEARDLSPQMDNPSGVCTQTLVMSREQAVRAVEVGLPLSGWSHRVVRRLVTEWEEAA